MQYKQPTQDEYADALKQMEKHITRNADGTFHLDAKDGPSIGVNDPVIFADLARSLEVTNRMILRGDIKPEDVMTTALMAPTALKAPTHPTGGATPMITTHKNINISMSVTEKTQERAIGIAKRHNLPSTQRGVVESLFLTDRIGKAAKEFGARVVLEYPDGRRERIVQRKLGLT